MRKEMRTEEMRTQPKRGKEDTRRKEMRTVGTVSERLTQHIISLETNRKVVRRSLTVSEA